MELFLDGYAFERQGRSPHFAPAAVAAVRRYKRRTPDTDFEQLVWEAFCLELSVPRSGQGANAKNNPLFPSFTGKRSVQRLVMGLKDSDYNMVEWADALLRGGRAKLAWEELTSVRGVGAKIASFFLRDIAHGLNIPWEKSGDPAYLQPVDVWVRRGADQIAALDNQPRPTSDWECADLLVHLCMEATLSPLLVNTGLWILGSEFVDDEDQFRQALTLEGWPAFGEESHKWWRVRAALWSRLRRTEAGR